MFNRDQITSMIGTIYLFAKEEKRPFIKTVREVGACLNGSNTTPPDIKLKIL